MLLSVAFGAIEQEHGVFENGASNKHHVMVCMCGWMFPQRAGKGGGVLLVNHMQLAALLIRNVLASVAGVLASVAGTLPSTRWCHLHVVACSTVQITSDSLLCLSVMRVYA